MGCAGRNYRYAEKILLDRIRIEHVARGMFSPSRLRDLESEASRLLPSGFVEIKKLGMLVEIFITDILTLDLFFDSVARGELSKFRCDLKMNRRISEAFDRWQERWIAYPQGKPR